jgi:hypothetical protein
MTHTDRLMTAPGRRMTCLVLMAVGLIGLWSCRRPRTPAAGRELSTVEGVSIVRVRSAGPRGSTSGGGIGEAYIEADSIDLLTCLGMVSNDRDPILVLTDLPAGRFRISARAESGGSDELTKKVCRAFSEAFGCHVTRRRVEMEVDILKCPNRQALLLADGTAEQGFYQHDEMPKGVRRTHFCSTLDNVAFIAGYFSRNQAAQNDIPSRKILLQQAYVNETGIPGFFQGTLDWSSSDPSVIRSSLLKLGFELTTGKRTIPALVVEPRTPGQAWTYLSDSNDRRAEKTAH